MEGPRALGVLKLIIMLPGSVLAFIPGLLLLMSHDAGLRFDYCCWGRSNFGISLVCLGLGLALVILKVRLLLTVGQGTPAPWDQPEKLIVSGLDRRVR